MLVNMPWRLYMPLSKIWRLTLAYCQGSHDHDDDDHDDRLAVEWRLLIPKAGG